MIGVGWWPFIGSVHARVMSYQHGFTLLEMLVVLTIVAILALVAIPGYRQPTEAVMQAEAGACLIRIAGSLERHRAQTGAYAGFAIDGSGNGCVSALAERYTIGFTDASGDGLTRQAPDTPFWALRADALGDAATDASAGVACSSLVYESTGRRGVIGSDGSVVADGDAIRRCWR